MSIHGAPSLAFVDCAIQIFDNLENRDEICQLNATIGSGRGKVVVDIFPCVEKPFMDELRLKIKRKGCRV